MNIDIPNEFITFDSLKLGLRTDQNLVPNTITPALVEENFYGTNVSGRLNQEFRQIIYGRRKIKGTLTFITTNTGTSGEWIHCIFTLAGHSINRIEEVWVNNRKVTFNSDWPAGWATGYFVNLLFLSINTLGGHTSADPHLLEQSAALFPNKWTTNHLQKDCASCYMILKYDETKFAEGFPEIEFVVSGNNNIYNPTTDISEYSNNAALVIADYITNSVYGLGSQVDWSNIQAQSIICDTNVIIRGETTTKLYTIDFVFDTSNSKADVLQKMQTAIGGMIVWQNSVWRVIVGNWIAPTITINGDDIIGDLAVRTKEPINENFNSVKGLFIAANDNWQETSYPAIVDSFNILNDGAQKFYTLDLPCTVQSSSAQRLARILLRRMRQAILVECRCTLKALQLELGDNVNLTLDDFGWNAKEFCVMGLQIVSDDGFVAVDLVLRETSSYIYNWSILDELAYDPAPDTELPDPANIVNPINLQLASGTDELITRADGTIFSSIKVTWTKPSDIFITSGGQIEIQYKKSSSFSWLSHGVVQGDIEQTHILNVQDNELYDVRIRSKNIIGVPSVWVQVSYHLVLGKLESPTSLNSFRSQINSYGVKFLWDSIPDKDLSFYQIREGTVWSDGVIIAEVKGTSYSLDLKAAGNHYFMIKAFDTSGNSSLTANSITVTIEAPSAPLVTGSVQNTDVILTWNAVVGLFAITDYLIDYESAPSVFTPIAEVKGNLYRERITWGGGRRFRVRSRDVAGNLSSDSYVDIIISSPSKVSAISAEVFDNNVLLKWSSATSGTLPIERYQIKKGVTYASSIVVGEHKGNFAAIFELVKGYYTYWIVAVDSAENTSEENSVTAFVIEPPDFELKDDQFLAYTGSMVNMIAHEGGLLAPVNSTESFEEHFLNNTWDNIEDVITDGYSIWVQPTLETAQYEEIIDYQTTLPSTLITFNFNQTDLVGNLVVNYDIDISEDSIAWTQYINSKAVYASNFRYCKFRLRIGDYTILPEPSAGELTWPILWLTARGDTPTPSIGEPFGVWLWLTIPV